MAAKLDFPIRSLVISILIHIALLFIVLFLFYSSPPKQEQMIITPIEIIKPLIKTGASSASTSQQNNQTQQRDIEKVEQEMTANLDNIAIAENSLSKEDMFAPEIVKQASGTSQIASALPTKILKFRSPKKQDFLIDKGQGKGIKGSGTGSEAAKFFGEKVVDDRIIFILDISGSINIAPALYALSQTFHSLEVNKQFNIIAFNDYARCWKMRLQKATKANKENADRWVYRLVRGQGGGTNIYLALKRAFAIAAKSKEKVKIYFISDGHSSSGKIVSSRYLLQAVKKWNRWKKVTITCIGIGSVDKTFLQSLAQQNKGVYWHRQ